PGSPESPAPSPQPRGPGLYACLYLPPASDGYDDQGRDRGTRRDEQDSADTALNVVAAIAEQFSPRYECHGADLVSIDVSGLERLLGPPQAIGEELRREAAARGIRAHAAVAGTRMAAAVLAIARPGLTVIPRGAEAEALA